MRRLAPQRVSDRWVSIALSVLLHGALLAALVYGWLLFRRPPRPAPTLAIEATVVDSRTVRGAERQTPQPAPPAAAPNPAPAAPPEETGPPPPTPEELAQREAQRQQAEAAAEEQRRVAAEKAAAEQAAVVAAAAAAAQREAEARAAAERKAREAAEAQKRADEQKRAEERQRQAEEQESEADLKRSLAAEEQARTERSGPARASWVAQIQAKISRAWLRPPTARSGIECKLEVTQVPGGTVTKVSIGECNGDQAVRESIEAAVYRASPLPAPPDPSIFDPVLHIDFKPD